MLVQLSQLLLMFMDLQEVNILVQPDSILYFR
jgi:hypothetical protein